MTLSLQKGGNLSLTKVAPALKKIAIGLGWDERATDGADFDLDATAFLLGANGRVRGEQDIVFYNQLKHASGAVEHAGDNLTGSGDGDDEVIYVNLPLVEQDVEKIAIVVTIHDAEARRQNFGMVTNAFIRAVDEANSNEVVRYDLSEEYSTETAMVMGELYRYNGEWKFKAVGQGYAGGLRALGSQYGINFG
ncbi:TerD family protein [Vibrio owensii]|uniref:TerD family protein n=1 Tax=Vibrio harveyi group TaxID=717610 RepID=UPI003CC6BC91